MGVPRRAVLAGVAGVVAATGFAVERTHPGIGRHLRALLEPAHHQPRPTEAPGVKINGTFISASMRGDRIGWTVAYPPGHEPGSSIPVCVAMPGRGSDHKNAFSSIALDRYLTRLVNAGIPAFAVASVDGGDHAYWHPRSSGEDPMSMLVGQFVPLLKNKGLDTNRLGLMGWSMGGFGAIILAEKMPALRVRAVAASSPALWHKASQTPDGAFDSAGDFARYDAFAGRDQLAGIPVRVACGESDPFYAASKDFVRGLPWASGTDFRPGGHDDAFWRDVAPGQLAFMGHALTAARVASS